MKNIIVLVVIGLSLVACKLDADLSQIREGCRMLEAAGVNQAFRLSREEALALTPEHRVILSNIKRWYRENCR